MAPLPMHPRTRVFTALTGGFLLGWGVTVWFLGKWVYDKAPEAVRRAVLVGLLSWFVLDSSGSIASGNASNAFFNVLVLLLAVGPLWLPAREEADYSPFFPPASMQPHGAYERPFSAFRIEFIILKVKAAGAKHAHAVFAFYLIRTIQQVGFCLGKGIIHRPKLHNHGRE
ncbi:MAG: hypothetical protein R3B47_13490 [Bacteroidia bacterium]